MQDFEKPGAFYLGGKHRGEAGVSGDELVFYDAGDLTIHAVTIGMSGSSRTGPGIGLTEEAAPDHVPVIAIDPRGDPGNLLLNIPELRGRDFEPWVDPRSAVEAGQSVTERMFFVTMLLMELTARMRRQTRSGSLRALLCMDEIFGYMPPVANPSSRPLFLILLQQARAFGVGLVLSTQNPAVLDRARA